MKGLLQFDFSVLDYIAEHFRCNVLDTVMPLITQLGNLGSFWILLALLLLCFPQDRARGVQLLLALVLSVLVCNLLLKNLVARIRPYDINTAVQLLIASPQDFSFPSGHTSASFAAVMVLFRTNWQGRWIALAVAILIAFSRLYLYVHFPTDVLGGAAVGTVMGWVATHIYPFLLVAFRRGG